MNYELIGLIAVVVIGGLTAIGARGKRAELERRLTLTERKLAQVVQKLAANGVEGMADLWQQPLPQATYNPPPRAQFDPIAQAELGVAMDQVQSLLMQGKKIQAIKVYRELTGVGLKEAKDAVEQLAGER